MVVEVVVVVVGDICKLSCVVVGGEEEGEVARWSPHVPEVEGGLGLLSPPAGLIYLGCCC